MERFIAAGRIVGTHGIQGELRVDPWVDSPEFLKKQKNLYFDKGQRNAGVLRSRVHKNMLLVTLQGVEEPTAGDALRGQVLYMDRETVQLPPNRYFIADLIGLQVYDATTGQYYGKLAEVLQTGANNVYRIENEDKSYLFPAVDHMIASTNLEHGRIEVLPIAGIFDTDNVEA